MDWQEGDHEQPEHKEDLLRGAHQSSDIKPYRQQEQEQVSPNQPGITTALEYGRTRRSKLKGSRPHSQAHKIKAQSQ